MNGSIKRRWLERVTWVANGVYTIDFIKSHDVLKPIAAVFLRFAIQVTSTGGGTMAAAAMDASVQLMAAKLTLTVNHRELGKVEIVNLTGDRLCQLWHLSNDLLGKEQEFLDSLPGAGANGDVLREFVIPLNAPWCVNPFLSYVDPRDVSSMQLQFKFPAATVYAATNFASAQLGTIDVHIDEIEDGIKEGAAYFVPQYSEHQHKADSVSEALVTHGIQHSGLIPLFSLQPFDASAVGNAQRNTAGLIRRVNMGLGGREILKDAIWAQLAHETQEKFPLSFTTTRRAAPVTVLADRFRNGDSMLDNRSVAIATRIDTKFDVQQGITAVTPAAGDRLDFMALNLLPVKRAEALLESRGYRR